MKTVWLISTVHRENGLANVDNLYLILKQLKPEVIFMELPSGSYNHYFTACLLRTPESDSVNIYRKDNPVEIVLVDSKAPDPGLCYRFDFLFNKIESTSDCFVAITQRINQYACQYGFPYLNSEKHNEHLAERKEEEFKTVRKLNDPQVTGLYELWMNKLEQRENEMLHNIREYSARHSYNRAVFLVGSAHSQSIVKKANENSNLFDLRLFNSSKEEWINTDEE